MVYIVSLKLRYFEFDHHRSSSPSRTRPSIMQLDVGNVSVIFGIWNGASVENTVGGGERDIETLLIPDLEHARSRKPNPRNRKSRTTPCRSTFVLISFHPKCWGLEMSARTPFSFRSGGAKYSHDTVYEPKGITLSTPITAGLDLISCNTWKLIIQ